MECLREKFYDGVVLDGRFQTISPLNHGSFGMVFMAKDLTTNDLVAIKCLTKRTSTGEAAESGFSIDDKSEELECHSELGHHPNIVGLIHSFETDAHVYLVLEFCSNGDLYEAIRTGCGPLETEHVRDFMLQLIDAVQYIHSKGIYHRDIKPENIFLDSAGTMKLGDFGLVTRDEWSYETTVGSDRYMAPEQYDSAGAGYSPAHADIWAVGICLLNILFSRNPFTTPTEADPIYLDFSRDRQSLFDVFPTMSQDTYEVIVQCMSLDPKKRSLDGARDALLRVISFTTFDESLDDFCTIPKTTAVSANREPLRTPSIQSPQVDQGSFPWAKALHASPPQQFRQLPAIPEPDMYDEDLFPSSVDNISSDWFSVKNTPSMASVLESNLGESMNSMAIQRPHKTGGPPRAEKCTVSGSLPINMTTRTKPMPMPSMSSVFGRKRDKVSKSWSDMWEEDVEEEEELAHAKELKQRQDQNSRTWSHDSKHEDVTVAVRAGLSEPKSSSFINIQSPKGKKVGQPIKDIDDDPNDGFFFQDHANTRQYSPPRYSPPSKRSNLDKWAALGDRRRGVATPNDKPSASEKLSDAGWRSRKDTARGNGLGFLGFGVGGFWDKDDKVNIKVKEWAKARDQCRHRAHDFGDLELGWGLWHDTNLHM